MEGTILRPTEILTAKIGTCIGGTPVKARKKVWGKGKAEGCLLLTWGEDAREKALVLVEGEKAAEAFQRAAVEGHIAVTWRNGAKAVDKADFSLCRDRKVILWPDNDEEGRAAMRTAGKMAIEAGALSVSMLSRRRLARKG